MQMRKEQEKRREGEKRGWKGKGQGGFVDR